MAKILVVEAEPAVQATLRQALGRHDWEVRVAASVAEGLRSAVAPGGLDVALVDLRLADGSGLQLVEALRRLRPQPQILLIADAEGLQGISETIKSAVFDVLVKPVQDLTRLSLQVRNALATLQLVREQARLQDELREREDRFQLMTRGAHDGLWEWDVSTNAVQYAPRWKEMLGFTEDEIGSCVEEWFGRVHPDDLAHLRLAIAAHLDGDRPHFEADYRLKHKDGSYRWMVSRGMAMRDTSGKVIRIAGSQTDITEHKATEARIQQALLLDPITDLPNRALLLDRLRQSMAHARRRDENRCAVLMLDLDRFKLVNESLGHSTGNALLVATGKRLQGCLRAGDTVARLGGDEFALVLDDVSGVGDALRMAEQIERELARPYLLGGHEVFATASIGIALSGRADEEPEDLIRDAETAMYRAKGQGRARYAIFDSDMHGSALRLLELDAALRRAIERKEFRNYYQPIISLDSGHIVGFEALVRWQHPDRGLLAPAEFIPFAEDTGLMVPIGEWALKDACRSAFAWQRAHDGSNPLQLSVNVSGRYLMHGALVEHVTEALEASRLAPSSLRIEITESVLVESAQAAAATLGQIKALGVRIDMDDFGTGYSSLSYLHRLPIDGLKVDQSFVSAIGQSEDDGAIVHTIVTLARILGLEVVAEGVERAEQLAQLRSLKCDYAQGYLISPPVSEEAASKLLDSQRRW